jgi:predicted RNase H-like nuclease (RuvC/YqgF family)
MRNYVVWMILAVVVLSAAGMAGSSIVWTRTARASEQRMRQQMDGMLESLKKENTRVSAEVEKMRAENEQLRADSASIMALSVRLKKEKDEADKKAKAIESSQAGMKETVKERDARISKLQRAIKLLKNRVVLKTKVPAQTATGITAPVVVSAEESGDAQALQAKLRQERALVYYNLVLCA